MLIHSETMKQNIIITARVTYCKPTFSTYTLMAYQYYFCQNNVYTMSELPKLRDYEFQKTFKFS